MSEDGTRQGDQRRLRWSGPGVPSQSGPADLLAQLERELEVPLTAGDLPPWSVTLVGAGSPASSSEPSPPRGLIRHRINPEVTGELAPRTDWRLGALLVAALAVLVGGTGSLVWTVHDLHPSAGPSTSRLADAAGYRARTVLTVLTGTDGRMLAGGLIGVDDQEAVCLLTPTGLLVGGSGSARLVDAIGGTAARSGTSAAQAVSTAIGVRVQDTLIFNTADLAAWVDRLGGIQLDVPRTLQFGGVRILSGRDRILDGQRASGYAATVVAGESPEAELERFYEVIEGVLMRMPSDPEALMKVLAGATHDRRTTLDAGQLASVIAALHDRVSHDQLLDRQLPLTPIGSGVSAGFGVAGERMSSVVIGPLATQQLAGPPGAALRVQLLVGDAGLAAGATARSRLEAARLNCVEVRPANAVPTATGKVEEPTLFLVPTSSAADHQHALTVAGLLGIPSPHVVINPGATSGADLSVQLGPDFVRLASGAAGAKPTAVAAAAGSAGIAGLAA